MRILYCLDGTFNSGGKERIVINKANWLASHGYDVAIFTTEQAGRTDFFPLKGVKRYDSDILFTNIKDKNPFSKFLILQNRKNKCKKILQNYIDIFKPDIIISTNGYEVSIVNKVKRVRKKIIESHFTRWFRLKRNRSGIWKIVDRILTKQDLKEVKKYDKLICLTNEDRLNWKEIDNADVINNFIEEKTFHAAPLENKLMIAVGRLQYQKGFDRLINAWKIVNNKFPDWKLNIFGDGELKDELNHQIEQLELKDSVNINVPTKNIHSEYLKSSALLMSSHYEGLPMVMLEAMETGLPVVSFDFPCGPKDLIKNGTNGFLIKEGDIEGMANMIGRLIEDREERKRMGKINFETTKKNYPDSIMEKWIKIFNEN